MIAFPVKNIPNARSIVESFDVQIAPSLCPQDELHVIGGDPAAIANALGISSYQELVDGERTTVEVV